MSLDQITDDALSPCTHGFFGRAGGASSGLFAGLNCGYGSSDQREIVTINRARVAKAVGVKTDHLITMHQVHSARAAVVDMVPAVTVEADGVVTAMPGVAVAVLTADCAPVLFADIRAGVIAAAHAGWKGALGGVLEATIRGMEQLGAMRPHIRAVIGPTISQAAYEVGAEFFDRFRDEDPDFARFFAAGTADHMQFDLPGFVAHQLRSAGVSAHWTGHCTYSDATRFYSFRRTTHQGESDYGRLISVIRL